MRMAPPQIGQQAPGGVIEPSGQLNLPRLGHLTVAQR